MEHQVQVQDEGVNFDESPPLPFPQRNLEHSGKSHHRDHLTVTENEGSPATRSDTWSCVIVVLTLCLFGSMTLLFGVCTPENVLLGPHSSILINPNHLFVESVKVVELKTGGVTVLVLLINQTSNHCKSMDQERRREQVGGRGPERSPLLSQKDDDLSSWGSSSYVSGSEDESLEDARDGKHVKDGEHNSLRRLCAICFDAPRDFLPSREE